MKTTPMYILEFDGTEYSQIKTIPGENLRRNFFRTVKISVV